MTITTASNAPDGFLDVWLRTPEGEDESEAEANTRATDSGYFIVEWCLTAVGLVSEREFPSYSLAQEWLEEQGFEDFSA